MLTCIMCGRVREMASGDGDEAEAEVGAGAREAPMKYVFIAEFPSTCGQKRGRVSKASAKVSAKARPVAAAAAAAAAIAKAPKRRVSKKKVDASLTQSASHVDPPSTPTDFSHHDDHEADSVQIKADAADLIVGDQDHG